MKRRGFFSVVTAAVAGLFGAKSPATAQPGKYETINFTSGTLSGHDAKVTLSPELIASIKESLSTTTPGTLTVDGKTATDRPRISCKPGLLG